MASVYGSFGGRAFATADGATAAVAPPATPAAPCNEVTTVSLGSGVTATVYAADGSPLACEVTWARGPWTFVLEGAPTRLPNGFAPTTPSTSSSASVPSGGIPRGPVATAILAQVTRTPLPPAPGVLVADLAPDGVHTTLRWAIDEAVYLVGVEHGAAQAVALASAMRAYPGRGTRSAVGREAAARRPGLEQPRRRGSYDTPGVGRRATAVGPRVEAP